MPDIPGVNAMGSEEIRLKWENAKQLIDVSPHGRQTALPPGPNLRRYQINHRNAQPLQTPSQPQMEVRTVGQNSDIRALLFGGANQLPVLAINARDVRNYFHQPHHR